MSFGEAISRAVLGGISAATGTAIERAQQKRSEAFVREGWDRQDAQTVEQRQYQDKTRKEEREYLSSEKDKDRSFQQSQKDKDRSFQQSQKDEDRAYQQSQKAEDRAYQQKENGNKPSSMKVTQTDEGVIATIGSEVYRVTQQGLIPLNIAPEKVPDGDEIVKTENESDDSFLDRILGYASEFMDTPIGGKSDKTMTNEALSNQNVQSGYGATAVAEKQQAIFDGKPYGKSEFDVVKRRYPNASDEQVLKSLDAYYSR